MDSLDSSNFRGGDRYEKFNFCRTLDGWFYGAIPGRVPAVRGGPWTVFFVVRHPETRGLSALGWYKHAEFTDKTPRPDYSYNSKFSGSLKYATAFKYPIKASIRPTVATGGAASIHASRCEIGSGIQNLFTFRANAGVGNWRADWAHYIERLIS